MGRMYRYQTADGKRHTYRNPARKYRNRGRVGKKLDKRLRQAIRLDGNGLVRSHRLVRLLALLDARLLQDRS